MRFSITASLTRDMSVIKVVLAATPLELRLDTLEQPEVLGVQYDEENIDTYPHYMRNDDYSDVISTGVLSDEKWDTLTRFITILPSEKRGERSFEADSVS
jgi:hypothetical protein